MDSSFFFDGTVYWSEGDEQAHFDWLRRIPCIHDVKGRGTRLFLSIEAQAMTDQDFRELVAVYRRYGGDLDQLNALKESMNA